MKKLFGPFIMLAVLASGFMSSCGPSAEELEQKAQHIADSLRAIAVADSLRQDSIQKAEQAAAEAAAAAAAADQEETNTTDEESSENTTTNATSRDDEEGTQATSRGDDGAAGKNGESKETKATSR